nr:DUF2188 domain-containing protein [Cupriavidus necator]
MPVGRICVRPAAVGWSLQKEGLREPLHFATLDAAIAAGWQYARRENGELEIRQQDGLIRLRSAVPAEDHVERTVTARVAEAV